MNCIFPFKKILDAAPARRPGYVEECRRLGKITGEGNSALIELTPGQFDDIRRRFSLNPVGRDSVEPSNRPGLGDAVHRIAGPIGRAIKWPCMKGDGSTELKPDSPCDQARQFLNKIAFPASGADNRVCRGAQTGLSASPRAGDSETQIWRPPAYRKRIDN